MRVHVRIVKCFNLSILECKSVSCSSSCASSLVLIYPYWNVNLRARRDTKSAVRFNLSILECKYSRLAACPLRESGFNLSILECKFGTTSWALIDTWVLIYPYWNVNICSKWPCLLNHFVVLYPYWNVNLLWIFVYNFLHAF